jgi:hypothetical protein
VITSTAAGLEQTEQVKIVPVGNYSKLLEEVKKHQLNSTTSKLAEVNS